MVTTEEPKPMTTVYPTEILTYHEWVDILKEEHNVIVSSKFLAKSVEDRIRTDEAIMYRLENQKHLRGDEEEVRPSILFGIKRFLDSF
jgi:hypothetical protein